MLAKALEAATPALPKAARHPAGRFRRDPVKYRRNRRLSPPVPDPPDQENTP